MNSDSGNSGFYKKLIPLCVAQTLGVFNDNAYKSVVIFTAIGLSDNYSENAFFMTLMTIVFVGPFIFFASLAGYAADKFIRYNILVVAKAVELTVMIIATFFLYKFNVYGIYPLVGLLFLMSSHSSFFSPAFYSSLPDIFLEKDISRANGIIGMCSFVAVIVGFALGIVVKSISGGNIYFCGIFFSILSLIGLAGAIKSVKVCSSVKERSAKTLKEFFIVIRSLIPRKDILIAMLGETYFYDLGSSVQTILILLGKFKLGLTKDFELGLLQLMLAIGMAIGCWSGGRLSRNRMELGLSFYGAVGLSFFLIMTAFCPGFNCHIGGLTIFPMVLCFLIMAGVSAGIFVIPLRVCQQERTESLQRGSVIAASNFLVFAGILASGMIVYLLTAGHKVEGGSVDSAHMKFLASYAIGLSPQILLLMSALITTTLAVVASIVHTEFLMRALNLFFTRLFYRTRIKGLENIPISGPAIIVANHTSVIDEILLYSTTSRLLRFIRYEDDTKKPYVDMLFKFFGYIHKPVCTTGIEYEKYLIEAADVLKKNGILCIFPERRITRNGLIGKFNDEIGEIVSRIDYDIPVIPVYIGGMWGSFFSYFFRKNNRLSLSRFLGLNIGRPVCGNQHPYQLRNIICELAAELELDPRPCEKTLHYRLACFAKKHPFKTLFEEYGGKKVRCLSMLVKSLILSKIVRKYKSGSDYIGILLPNSNAAAAAILSVMYADKTPAMLNYTMPQALMKASISEAKIDVILSSRLFLEKLNMNLENTVFLEDIALKITPFRYIIAMLQAFLLPASILLKANNIKKYKDLFSPAVLLFSSGSGGIPKGVLLSHHNLNSNVNFFSEVMRFDSNDKITGNLPVFHSFGFNVCFWVPIKLGAGVVYIKNPIDADSIVKAVKIHKTTILTATSTFFQSYLRKAQKDDFRTLRLIIIGGEKMMEFKQDNITEYTDVVPIEGYGCTELSPIVSINTAENIEEMGMKCGKYQSIGKPLTGIAAKILDVDSLCEAPPGRDGILMIKGATLMLKYINEEIDRSKYMIGQWYNTGDVARIDDDGYISITGRISRFSKIGGEMISHQKIENLIYKFAGNDSSRIFVAGLQDSKKGEKIVVLYTELSKTPDEISEYLRDEAKLTNLWIPRPGNYYKIENFPILGSGKIDFQRIKEILYEIANGNGDKA